MKTSARRIEILEKSLEKNMKILEDYYEMLAVTSDPRERERIRAEIEVVEQIIQEIEIKLADLQKDLSTTKSIVEPFNISSTSNPLDPHFNSLIENLRQGRRLILVLGAGINLYDRPINGKWQPGQFAPSTTEFASLLAENFQYPNTSLIELARVSQYAEVMHKPGPLYGRLRSLFETNYTPTLLHLFIARLPMLLRNKFNTAQNPIIVTTNYDDLLEKAFQEVGQPYDLLSYVAEGEQRNKFIHWQPAENQWIPIDDPNRYLGLGLTVRPLILKMYGVLERFKTGQDNLVITEDQFINYMTRTEISKLIPATLMTELIEGSLLFLGYNINDWSLRVILHRIWGERELNRSKFTSWAVETNPQELERKLWLKWDIEVVKAELKEYIEGLRFCLESLSHSGATK